MPDTVEHRVKMHRLSRARHAAGLPVWDRRINFADVFHNDAMTFTERRDTIVRRLRASRWLEGRDELDELVRLVDELADTQDGDEFDGPWDGIYDHADYDRVWINTR